MGEEDADYAIKVTFNQSLFVFLLLYHVFDLKKSHIWKDIASVWILINSLIYYRTKLNLLYETCRCELDVLSREKGIFSIIPYEFIIS